MVIGKRNSRLCLQKNFRGLRVNHVPSMNPENEDREYVASEFMRRYCFDRLLDRDQCYSILCHAAAADLRTNQAP
jgi:hypothetical protein